MKPGLHPTFFLLPPLFRPCQHMWVGTDLFYLVGCVLTSFSISFETFHCECGMLKRFLKRFFAKTFHWVINLFARTPWVYFLIFTIAKIKIAKVSQLKDDLSREKIRKSFRMYHCFLILLFLLDLVCTLELSWMSLRLCSALVTMRSFLDLLYFSFLRLLWTSLRKAIWIWMF